MVEQQFTFDCFERYRADAMKPGRGEIVVDLFCGGGGASVGIEAAIGSPVDVAINHSKDAIFCHERNHPATRHWKTDVFDLHPLEVTKGRPVGLLWLSPDCTHFSKSRGGAPKKKNIRSLATVGLWYARQMRPRVICLENVEEFTTWGRLDKRTKQADPRKKGEGFHKFVRRLRQHGYRVEWRVLKACDYGAPTIRKRLFLVARCDGQPIRWPKPTHGPSKSRPYRTAAECIDFSIPTVSIFATPEEVKAAGLKAKRPLAEKTMERIFRGVQKFVIDNQEPFIVPQDSAPFITECANGSNQRNMPPDSPLRTICAQVKGGHFAMVAANIERMHSTSRGESASDPLSCITAQTNHHALVTSHLLSYHAQQGNESRCYPHTQPLPTVDGSNRFAEVRAFLLKYYGQGTGQSLNAPLDTITGQDRFGLVTIHGVDYRIVDIGLRMLRPEELLRAQFGRFAEGYRLDGLTKSAAVRMIGNSVCPDLAYALVKANFKRKTTVRR